VALERRSRELATLCTTHGFRDPAARLAGRGILDQILAAWLCCGFAAGSFPHAAPWQAPDWLWAVLDRIEARLAHGVNVPDLAALAGLSQAHFTRRFRALLGRPPQVWIHERRLVRARSLLIAQPDLAMGEIADLAGFGDAYQFSRLFRRDCGLPPDRWRRAHLAPAPAENINRG
jgi:AraC-like DNA-binding protein